MAIEPLQLHLKTITSMGESAIMVIARDEAGKRFSIQVSDFSPYFFVQASEENLKSIKKRGLTHEPGIPGIDGTETFKVYGGRKRAKGFPKTWEADVPYTRRFLIDTGIQDGFLLTDYTSVGDSGLIIAKMANFKPIAYRNKDRLMLYDIETNKPEGSKIYSPPIKAEGAVTALTYQDNFDGTRYHTHFWHPERGVVGRPRKEIRNQWSDAFQKLVEWSITTYGSEEEMHVGILQYLKTSRPDVMQAWNGHMGHHRKNQGGFDAPYMINRLRQIGLSPGQLSPLGNAFAGYKVFGKETAATSGGKFQCSIDGVQLVDMMVAYQVCEGGFTAQVPFSDLKRVTEKYTGKKLKKYPGQLDSMHLHDSEAFLTYSFNDVDALVALEKEKAYLKWARDLQQFVGVEDANKVFAPMALITTMLLRIAKEDGVCLPTSLDDAEDDGYEAEGGFVMDPRVKGVQRRVGVFDLSAMYVNIIISGNLSPETHVPNPTEEQMADLICVPSDLGPQFFLKPSVREGLLPKACKRLKALRKKYDDLIEKATSAAEVKELKRQRNPSKQLLLAVFGTSLSEFFTLGKREVGSSITGTGRFIMHNLDEETTNLGDEVSYSDTDSGFISLPEDDPVGHGEWLSEQFNAMFSRLASTMNMESHSLEIGLETIYDPFVMGETKKMYSGYVVWSEGKWQDTPEFQATGVPGIKSDAAPITKETSMAVLKAILNGVPPLEIIEYVRSVHDGVLSGDIPIQDVIKVVTMNGDIDNPRATQTYIMKGAKYGRMMYDFQYPVGAKVRPMRLKGSDEVWVAIPEGEDLPKDLAIDIAHHADLTVIRPSQNILTWVDLDIGSIKHGTPATTQRRL